MTDIVDPQKPWFLLCEGVGDVNFFQRLMEAKAPELVARFSIRRPLKEGEYSGSRTNFGRYLNYISVAEPFQSGAVEALLVVSDKDADEKKSFAEVQAQLKLAPDFAIPDQPSMVASKKGSPKVIVLMIPIKSTTGNLESLCLEAAYQKWNLKDHLDRFVDASPSRDWTPAKQSKARMQTILANTNKDQPETGFAMHWNSNERYRIPLDHDCFADIVAFLHSFESLVTE